MNFKELKKKSANNLEKLVREMDKSGKDYSDARFWKPTTDPATGRGTALIRFLPAISDEVTPWVKYISYSFQGPGGWYIENSPCTLDMPCPVREDNQRLWNTGIKDNKDIASKRTQRKNYVSNILVLSDPKNPEAEGKVFLYKYGSQVYKKIQSAMKPEFEDNVAFDPFDFWKGANFRIRIKRGENKLPTYEDSVFEAITPLMDGNDAELEKIWKQQYDLTEFISEKNFKSYDELKAKFDRVVGNTTTRTKPATTPTEAAKASRPSPVPEPSEDDVPWPETDSEVELDGASDDDDDDTLAQLRKMNL